MVVRGGVEPPTFRSSGLRSKSAVTQPGTYRGRLAQRVSFVVTDRKLRLLGSPLGGYDAGPDRLAGVIWLFVMKRG